MTATDQADRLGTITRALSLLDTLDHDTLCSYLAETRLNDNYQQDPERLQERFRNVLQAGAKADLYIPYRAAQEVLRAAGQPV